MIPIGFDTYTISNLESLEQTARLLELKHIDLHLDSWGAKSPDESRVKAAIDLCVRNGWTYVLNIEGAPLGQDLPPAITDYARQSGLCRGVLLDECDWQHINAHWVLPQTALYGYHEQHYFGETEGLDLRQAYDLVHTEAARRSALYRQAGLPIASEHLYPAMMHNLARAGFAVSPKVLKETWGPVMLAVALGAAKQYDTDLWVCVDEWWHPEMFGHPMKRYRSALLLAYGMGVNLIHSEGGRFAAPGWNGKPMIEEQGALLREFATRYVPEHPRPYTFRDARPTTAILRFDDTCFDIRQRTLGEYPGPLYGHIPAGPESTEWLTIWNALSHGYLRTDSITHNWETKLPIARSLFAPLNNVVVYDHLASDKDLAGVETIFLTGVYLSPETLAAVGRRVRQGAVCLTPERFLPPEAHASQMDAVTIIPDGAGQWVVPKEIDYLHYETWTNGPRLPALREALGRALGPEDTLRYRFGEKTLTARMFAGDPDVLEFNLS